MNTLKNAAKLLICGFAILGLAACSSGGSAASNGGSITEPIDIILGDVNQNDLSNYTLTNIDTTLLTAVEQTIAAHSATSITVTIANNDSTGEQSTSITIDANDNWKTVIIGFPADLTEGPNNLTITVTYAGNSAISAETTTSLTVTYDGILPSITSFTDQSVDIPSFLPITDFQDFTFDITFSEPITAGSLTILTNPTGLVTPAIAFNDANTVATITATPTIPANQTGTLTISVEGYEDGFGNSPALAEQVLYEEIDIQLPTIADIGSQPTDITDITTDDYIVTYTFSEEIEALAGGDLTASNFTIAANINGTITDVTHDSNNRDTVMLAITSTVDIIDITVTDFIDTVGNKGSANNALVRLNDISVLQANSIIGDDDITFSDNYKFTLIFNRLISASTLTTSDFVNTNLNSNIQIVSFTPDTGEAQNLEVVFSITDENDTAAVEFTIAAGTVGIGNITNSEPIVISIDRGPRFLSIPENSKTEFNKDYLGNEISYTLTFSEAVNGLVADDFIIEPDSDGVSVESVSVNSAAVTVVFTVAEDTDGTFSIDLTADSYTDQAGNGNREVTKPILSNIIIDTIDPEISTSDFDAETNTLTLEFSEVVTVASTDIVLTNATINTFTNNGGKVEAVLSILNSDTETTVTINRTSYSDTLGNVGENDYTLTIAALTSLWLAEGICENFSFDGTGDGSASNPYQISNICQLQNIADDDITADGVAYTNLLDKSYILTENIDATYTSNWDSGKGFNPLGDNSNKFDGTFDGDGFIIRDLTIDTGKNYVGLFGYTSSTGTIVNVTLENVSIKANSSVGGLVGRNEGIIDNVSFSGDVEGNSNIGSFVGNNTGTIENSSSSGNVTGNNDNIGGFVGQNTGTIENSSSSADVAGNHRVGGFVGFNDSGTIESSISSGNVEGNDRVGGFVGNNNTGTIENSSSSGDVSGNDRVGGFVGQNTGTIENSSSSADVAGNHRVGGFVGFNENGTIESSISSGNVEGNDDIGGFVGNDNNGTYSGNSSCQQNELLPVAGNNANITGITAYDANCEIILISTASNLQAINDNVSGSYILVKDIDLIGVNFTPLGNDASSFDGIFDGGGFTIRNLIINLPTSNSVGLFGVNSGTIENLTLTNVDITGDEAVGGLVGLNSGTIENITLGNINITGSSNIGGLVGSDNNGTYSGNDYCQSDSLPVVGNDETISGIVNNTCISTVEQLQAVNSNLEGNYRLIADIDVSDVDFTPLGNVTNEFGGLFNGNGFTISNLTINSPASSYLGLFGVNSGTIENLTLENVDITGNENIGGLVGSNNEGTIENVSVENVTITGSNNIGGFIGSDNGGNYSGNTYCQVSSLPAAGDGTVVAEVSDYICVGTAAQLQAISTDLSGNYRLIKDIDVSSINNFDPLGSDSNEFDGTFDGDGFTIQNLTINRNENYVGLFGYNTGTIENVTLENVSIDASSGSSVGGIVGRNDGIIDNISFTGSIEGKNSIGGLVGHNTGTIKNSISVSSATGTGSNIGGFVGQNVGGSYTDNRWCDNGVNNSLEAVGNVAGVVAGINVSICISTADELQAVRNNRDGKYLLINDIDVSSISNFNPIGGYLDAFTGIFDGNSFTIRNLTINREEDVALFGWSDGIIRNVILDDVNIVGGDYVGGLVSESIGGTIENNRVSGSVSGNSNVGGFVGLNGGGTYTNNAWCKPAGSSLSAVGSGSVNGIVTLDENCE